MLRPENCQLVDHNNSSLYRPGERAFMLIYKGDKLIHSTVKVKFDV